MNGAAPALLGRLARGGAWVALGKGAGALATLAMHAQVARNLPADQLGAYFFLLSLVLAAAAASQMSLGQTAIRLIASAMANEQPGRARAAARQLSLVALVGGGAVATALVLGGSGLAALAAMPAIVPAAPLAALWLLLMIVQALLGELWRGLHDIPRATVFGGPLATLLALAGLTLMSRQDLVLDLETALATIVSAHAISITLGLSLLLVRIRALAPVGRLRASETLSSILPLLLATLPWQVMDQAHVLLLGVLGTADEVAVYGASYRLVAMVAIPLVMLNAVLAPLISDLHTRGERLRLEQLLQGTAALIGLSAALGLALIVLLGGDLLTLLYGPGFRAGAWPLTLLCLAQLINAVSGPSGIVMMMTGHNLALLVIVAACAVLELVLLVLLIPAQGMQGSALAHGITLTVLSLALLLASRRLAGVWTYASFAPGADLLLRRGPA